MKFFVFRTFLLFENHELCFVLFLLMRYPIFYFFQFFQQINVYPLNNKTCFKTWKSDKIRGNILLFEAIGGNRECIMGWNTFSSDPKSNFLPSYLWGLSSNLVLNSCLESKFVGYVLLLESGKFTWNVWIFWFWGATIVELESFSSSELAERTPFIQKLVLHFFKYVEQSFRKIIWKNVSKAELFYEYKEPVYNFVFYVYFWFLNLNLSWY